MPRRWNRPKGRPNVGCWKSVSPTNADEETVAYVLEVTNTGDVPLANLALADDRFGNISLSKTTPEA